MASAFHKYRVGEKVSFLPDSGSASHLRGIYTIVRLLPSETRDRQYRVRSDLETHERVVLESQLAVTSVKAPLSGPWAARAMKPA
jgi:hypothetical protein